MNARRGEQHNILKDLLDAVLLSAMKEWSLTVVLPWEGNWSYLHLGLWNHALMGCLPTLSLCPDTTPLPVSWGISWVQLSHTNAPFEDSEGSSYVTACYQENSELHIALIQFSVYVIIKDLYFGISIMLA